MSTTGARLVPWLADQVVDDVVVALSARSGPTTTATSDVPMELIGAAGV